MKSVAIIGAGVSGLCTLRHILTKEGLEPTVYEAAQSIGGAWLYNDNVVQGEGHVCAPSSMYENLITNQPKQIMELPDLKFKDDLPTFLTHKMVWRYLKRYCVEYDLKKAIKFQHQVKSVSPVPKKRERSGPVSWRLTVLDVANKKTISKIFDFIIVCNGHYAKPKFPITPGIRNFSGEVFHSRYYRRPDPFSDKEVLVIGAGSSGIDISIDVAAVAKKVYLSNKGPRIQSELPPNIIEVPEVSYFNEDGKNVTFCDGQMVEISSVIYCTGYLYDFPFLDEKCGVFVDDKRITPLFKHIVNIDHHNMLFVGIPGRIPVFRLVNLQAIYATGVACGEIALPSRAEMLENEACDFNARLKLGWPKHKAHDMHGRVFEYSDYLASAAGAERIPNNFRNLYNFILRHRAGNVAQYKTQSYVLNEDNEYVIEGEEKQVSRGGANI